MTLTVLPQLVDATPERNEEEGVLIFDVSTTCKQRLDGRGLTTFSTPLKGAEG